MSARRWRMSANPWLLAVITALLSIVLAVISHRLWNANLGMPWMYSVDGLQYLMYSKGIHDNGWLLENGLLGAPFGLLMYDWPEGGWISFVGVRLFDALTGDWVAAHNLLYLAGYPLAALAALWALRRLAIAPALAVALAVLYSILPYHLDRQEHHYVLGLYYGLPPLLSYAATIAAGRSPLRLRRGSESTGQWLRRLAGPLSAAVLAGLMSVYYVAFAGIFVLAAGVFGWLRARRPGVLLGAIGLGLVIAAAFTVQYSPSLLYRLANGTNSDVSVRYIGEVELYPLKLADLLLPVPNHPIGAFAALRERYSNFPSRGQVGLALGVLGSLGLVLALAGLTAAAAARGRAGSLVARLRPHGWLVAVGLAVGMLGGLATLLTMAVPALRAWDRIAIAIAFFCLASLGVTLTVLRRRLPRSLRAPVLVVLAGLLLAGGTFDQAGTGVWVRPYARLAAEWRADDEFVRRTEALLPAGAMVYQLPYIPFPEWGAGELQQNDHVRMYLHSHDLAWSYGYMRGREPGWQIVQARSAMADRLALMRALGFAAVYVNLDGYPTTEASPLTDAQVIAALDTELGPPALVQGPLRLYLLNGGQPGAQLAADARDPVWMRWASGFDQMYWIDDSISHRARADAAVELRNERATSRTVEVSFVIRADADAPPRDIEVTWPDGEVELIPFSGPAVAVSRSLSLAPGTSQLRLSVPDAPPRGFAYVLVDLAVVDASLVELLPPPPPTAVRALP